MTLRIALAALLVALVTSPTGAAPRIPVSDQEVVEKLPSSPGDAQAAALRPWREALRRDPTNLTIATRLARSYVDIGRTTGDPRYAGYAEAALAPWWSIPDPPREVRVLRAILSQRVHRFDAALADLDVLIAIDPRNAQARLTRATVLQVQGKFDAAARECDALRPISSALYAESCAAGVASLSGDLARAQGRLAALAESGQVVDAGSRAWLLGLLAEMAERGGDNTVAERWYRQSLADDPEDQYVLAAFADFLLERRRPAEVTSMLGDRQRADGLLLRYALAAAMQGTADATSVRDQLRSRFEASHRRGDSVHLREEARFALDLARDPQTAVRLARDNWAVQKEPADALILLRAATAARDEGARELVKRWVTAARLQDVRIAALLSRGAATASR